MQLTGEPDFIDPTGHCVRLVYLSPTGRELCEELEWFWGSSSEENASKHLEHCLDPALLGDYEEGNYKLTIHEAYEKQDRQWFNDNPVERIIFKIKKRVTMEVIER